MYSSYILRGENDDEALDLGDVKINKHINFSNKQGEIQETKLGEEQEKRRNHTEYWDLSHEYETGEATNAYQCIPLQPTDRNSSSKGSERTQQERDFFCWRLKV